MDFGQQFEEPEEDSDEVALGRKVSQKGPAGRWQPVGLCRARRGVFTPLDVNVDDQVGQSRGCSEDGILQLHSVRWPRIVLALQTRTA